MEDPKVFLLDFDRPNIIIHIEKTSIKSKEAKLLDILHNIDRSKKTIIYVPTIKIGNALLESLRRNGFDTEFFHGRLDNIIKASIQDRFSDRQKPFLNLIIATNAFGMGIDIKNIRFIVHWSLTKSLNSYYQEIGRAGRDNKVSLAILLHASSDTSLIRFIINTSIESANISPNEKAKRKNIEYNELEQILKFIANKNCLRKYIHEYFGSEYTRIKKSFFLRVLYSIIGIKIKENYCCTNCDKLYKKRKLLKVINLVNMS